MCKVWFPLPVTDNNIMTGRNAISVKIMVIRVQTRCHGYNRLSTGLTPSQRNQCAGRYRQPGAEKVKFARFSSSWPGTLLYSVVLTAAVPPDGASWRTRVRKCRFSAGLTPLWVVHTQKYLFGLGVIFSMQTARHLFPSQCTSCRYYHNY